MGVVITIDGLAGCKKTPTAALLAQTLGFYHLNSGLLYRQLAVVAKRMGYNTESEKDMSKLVGSSLIAVFDVISPRTSRGLIKYKRDDDAKRKYLMDNAEFYGTGIATMASKMASSIAIRDFLTAGQRSLIAYAQNVVLEGRDAGTSVFPEANYKFWFYANPVARAKWKVQFENIATDSHGLKKISLSLAARDLREMGRKINPLTIPENAESIGVSGVDVEILAEEIKKVVNGSRFENLRKRIKNIKLATEMKKSHSSTRKIFVRKIEETVLQTKVEDTDDGVNSLKLQPNKKIRQSVMLSEALYRRVMKYKLGEVVRGRRTSFQSLVTYLLDKFFQKKGLQ